MLTTLEKAARETGCFFVVGHVEKEASCAVNIQRRSRMMNLEGGATTM